MLRVLEMNNWLVVKKVGCRAGADTETREGEKGKKMRWGYRRARDQVLSAAAGPGRE